MAKAISLFWAAASADSAEAPKAQRNAAGWGLLLAALLICQVGLFCSGLHRPLHGSTDFRAFYAAGHMVEAHDAGELYRYARIGAVQQQLISPDDQTLPFLYPPFAAVLFAPLSVLPYPQAFAAFTILNFGALLLAGFWLRDRAGRREWPAWLVSAIALYAVPVLMVLEQGQISLLLLLVYLAADREMLAGRDLRAGILLSLSLVKFQYFVPVLLLVGCWRRWRAVAGAAAGGTVLLALSWFLVGWNGLREYLAAMLHITARTALDPAGAHAAYGMYAGDMPNLHGLVFWLTGGARAGLGVTLAITAAFLVWAARQKASLPLALCVAMLVSYHMQAYDLSLLLLGISAAAEKAVWRGGWWNSQRRRPTAKLLVGVAAGMLAVPVAPALLLLRLSVWLCVPLGLVVWALALPQAALAE